MNGNVGMVRFNAGTLKHASIVQYFSDRSRSLRRIPLRSLFCSFADTAIKLRRENEDFKVATRTLI
jgi:hypothetical protein